jgi:outer membrane protein assembly factor BamB
MILNLNSIRFSFVAAIGALAAGSFFVRGVTAAAALENENWPQWRGPLATGESPTARPPLNWSEDKNIKWKGKVPGAGTASPIIWKDSIFLLSAIPTGKKTDEKAQPENPQQGEQGRGGRGPRSEKPTEVFQFVVISIDRASGKTKWQKVAREEVPHEGHHPDHDFASASPITDGETLFAFFGSRGLHAYDLNGNLKWQKDLGRMQTKMGFGEGSSPALHGNTLVVNWDHEGDDFIVAFDKHTGIELWRQSREEDTSWSTPLVVEYEGKAQVVTAATRKVRSYDLDSGKLVWETEGLTPNSIPTPVAGDGMVFATAGFRGNKLLAIRLGKSGTLGSDAIAWSLSKSTPYVPSPLLYEDRIYFYSSNNGILSCFDAKTGKPLIDAERIQGLQGVYASPVAANGRIYLAGRNGTTVVIKSGEKLEVLATNTLSEAFNASPALAGKDLVLRGRENLYCISE